jgi:PAS domain S-box-containing protein
VGDEIAKALRERDRRMRLIFRQVPGAIWTTDRDLRITSAVGKLREATGLDDEHIVGSTVGQLVGTDEPTDVAVAHHRAALAGDHTSFRYDFHGRCYEVHAEPLHDGGPEIVGCIGVAVDVTDRERTDEELARSQTWLLQAQRAAHVGSWEWDIGRDVVVWSDELHRIYGVEKSEAPVTYARFLGLVHPDDLEHTREVIFDAFRQRKSFSYEHRIVRPDGAVRMLHTRGKVVDETAEGPPRMLGVCWDITEHQETTHALERSVSLLRATLEATGDGLLVVDREGRIVAHSQSFLSMWHVAGKIDAGLDDQRLRSLVTEQLEDPEAFTKRVDELYAAPELESLDVLRFKDGRVFERYSRPQRLGDEVVGRVWSFRDVTDRERLLRRALFLADASRLLNSLDVEPALESVACLAVPYLGDAVAIDLLSDAGGPRRLLSIAREPFAPISGELPPALFAGHSVVRPAEGQTQLTVPLMARGALLGALTFAAAEPRRYGDAELELAEELARRAALAIENARLYRRANEALVAREQFLSIAAHEIRGPITSLHLAVQSLRRNATAHPVSGKMLEIIEREERRITRLVDELLDVTRARSGQLHLDLQDVDLSDVAREVAARLGPDLARSGSSLSMTTESSVVGRWDRSRLEQVVQNLLLNAIKFGEGAPVEISVAARGEMATLTVCDHGIGIASDLHARIFRPFERGVSARHYGGLGLGLYIVQTIVEALGGTVTVDSAPGAGASFTVELPRRNGA